jgi:hypothetical protein
MQQCRDKWGRGEAYTGFWWGYEGKRPLGRPRSRWEDNIKTNLQEVGYGGMEWFELSQDSDRWRTHTCECGNEPSVSIKCEEFLD